MFSKSQTLNVGVFWVLMSMGSYALNAAGIYESRVHYVLMSLGPICVGY